jgi:hypothetical protein
MNNNALLALWSPEEMPACSEGGLGTEDPSDRISDMNACYMAMVEHGIDCDSCNEV